MKPLLVGEANPYGDDPKFALYPLPERASGHRLCTLIMGLSRGEYLRRFDRVNLCPTSEWSMREARETARTLQSGQGPLVLLGRKVVAAFGPWGGEPAPFTVYHGVRTYYDLPHPSGLCREWSVPGAFERARALLAPLLAAEVAA